MIHEKSFQLAIVRVYVLLFYLLLTLPEENFVTLMCYVRGVGICEIFYLHYF